MRYVGNRFLEQDNLTTLNAYTNADAYAFLDIPGRDVARPELENLRISNARAQFDECSLCCVVRYHIPGPNPPRRTADL